MDVNTALMGMIGIAFLAGAVYVGVILIREMACGESDKRSGAARKR